MTETQNKHQFIHLGGGGFTIVPKQALQTSERLPPNNYTLSMNDAGQYIFTPAEKFVLPSKLYGNVRQTTKRFLTTFDQRPLSTGILLYGEKGSGKSLQAKHLCATALEKHDIPTLIINAPWHGDRFNSLIQSIEQPMIVLFDEFEKTYREKEHQESTLTLFDGVFPTKKLFLLTCNNKWEINTNFHNRPGRIYYSVEYGSIPEEQIREYAAEKLKEEHHHYIDQIITITGVFSMFSFDMLVALIEEINRYGESPRDCMRFLNVRPDSLNIRKRYKAKIYSSIYGDIPTIFLDNGGAVLLDLSSSFSLQYYIPRVLFRSYHENEGPAQEGLQTKVDKIKGLADASAEAVPLLDDDEDTLIAATVLDSMKALPKVFTPKILAKINGRKTPLRYDTQYMQFEPSHMKRVDVATKTYFFENDEGDRVEMVIDDSYTYDEDDYFGRMVF